MLRPHNYKNFENFEIIETLLSGSPTKNIRIDSDDYFERYKQLEFLSSNERLILAKMMVKHIIYSFHPNIDEFSSDPLSYMLPPNHENIIQPEIQCHSNDWNLMIFEDDKNNKIYDFSGWPGDNQYGIIWLMTNNFIYELFTIKSGHCYVLDTLGKETFENLHPKLSKLRKIYGRKRLRIIYNSDDDGYDDNCESEDE